jgi:triacylglycerol lipase
MSVLNFRPIEFYKPDAFSAFTPTSDLDLGTARGLMWASQLAYELDTQSSKEQVDKVKTILDRLHLELIQIVPIPAFPKVPMTALPLLPAVSRDALVIGRPGAIIIAFAGTDPPRVQDWLVNFSALPVAATGVSRGLSEAAEVFAPLLKPLVEQHSDRKLFVTGHSLGGSLGVALAYELSRQNCNAEAVYTFGMPRAGDPRFAADYDQRLGRQTFRFVHGDDLVPTVPPPNLAGILHQHVGWFIHCARGAKFALAQKSADTKSNEPVRENIDIIRDAFDPTGFGGRLRAAFNAAMSGNAVDSVIELSPDRIRQHLQDQYIAALTA